MAPRIFITGVSGYIGGQTLASIVAKHPEYTVVGLVRSEEKKQQILAKLPSAEFVIGDLDSSDLLIEEAKKANVVLHLADADHLGAINALITGLAAGKKNGAYIHLSGSASIIEAPTGFGNLSPKIWDDVADLTTISTFDSSKFHAASDQLVLSLGKLTGIKTAILEPPMVYGRGDGIAPFNKSIPKLHDIVKARGKMFRFGEAKQAVSFVHVKDFGDAAVLFIEQALEPSGGRAEWGEKGIYYVEAEEIVFRELVDAIGKEMIERGLIKSKEVDVVDAQQGVKIHPYSTFLWGSNMRVRATRLRALGWVPKQVGVLESVPDLFA